VKEVDYQSKIVTELFEYVDVVHKVLFVDFKWNRVVSFTFFLISGFGGDCADHIKFLRSFSHREHLPEFGSSHAADIGPCVKRCTDFMFIDIY